MLEQLIQEGESMKRICYYKSDFGEYMSGEPYERWIAKSIIFLETNYPDHTLTTKFKVSAEKAVGYGVDAFEKLMGILKGIKDMNMVMKPENVALISSPTKIFISHSSKDKAYCNLLVDLLHDVGIKTEDIFYSSLEEHGVPLGEDFLDYIKERFSESVYVLFMLSKDFYESKICLAEMGAAWVKSCGHLPILIPPTNYDDMEGVIRPTKNSMLINDISKLDSLKAKIESSFNLQEKIDFHRWQRKRNDFIEQVNKLIDLNKRQDIDIYVDQILDGAVRNSRLKLTFVNNSKKVIRPVEVSINVADDIGNKLNEVFDDLRISSIILKPFEKISLYIDIAKPCESFRKNRITENTTENRWDILN